MSKSKRNKRYSRLRPPAWLATLSPHTVKFGKKSFFILFDHRTMFPKDLPLDWKPNVWINGPAAPGME